MRPTSHARRDAILTDHGAKCFDSLVAEYAAMGYSEYATARRLLGIDVRTMRSWLAEPVQFTPHAGAWRDPLHNAASVLKARKANGTLRFIEHDGQRRHLSEWARLTGIKATTIARRIDVYGWPIDRALTVKMGSRAAHNPHRPKPTKAQGLDFRRPEKSPAHGVTQAAPMAG